MVSATLVPTTSADQPPPPPPEVAEAEQPVTEVLPAIPPNPAIDRMLAGPVLTDAQRQRFAVWHGRLDALSDDIALSPGWSAYADYLEQTLTSPLDVELPGVAYWQAMLRYQQGDMQRAEAIAEHAGVTDDPPVSEWQVLLLRSRIDVALGRFAEATQRLQPIRERFMHGEQGSAADLTAAAEAIALLASLEGRPSADFQTAMSLLSQAQSRDPLYWPAKLAEANLLYEKDNREESAQAALEALSLNPKLAEAWYLLGRLNVDSFDFAKAEAAAAQIDAIAEQHPLAVELRVRSLLRQNDPQQAAALVRVPLSNNPESPQWLAWQAAVAARAFDEAALQEALARFDEAAPRSPLALRRVGEVFSEARQYERSDEMLKAAIARQPNDSAPRLERGLMLMQWGELDAAREELANAVRLDPFHRRANNTLSLVEQMVDWPTIRTEHFVIRHAPGVDAVLASDMPEALEQMRSEVTRSFAHEPPRITQIDILPDESSFAVRITGEPEIWTIAASTGDTIALTPPRPGARQAGGYDWLNVLRHEYVHTVTLSATNNRLPHWFTEAAAVGEELTGRSYETCRLLAAALQDDGLFAYDQINWGFVRPRKPTDRALAYAQAHWMLEYIEERFGRDAVLSLMRLYAKGTSDADALREVTSLDTDTFMADFRAWAMKQVESWGLKRTPVSEAARAALLDETPLVTLEQVDAWLAEHPGHPDLLRLRAQVLLLTDQQQETLAALDAYASARPVDPWPVRQRARLALAGGDDTAAREALEALDRQEGMSPEFAKALVSLHRKAGQLDEAAHYAQRALHRDPFNASLRELAAAVELQRGRRDEALRQVQALTLLEPDRPIHQQRLEALQKQR